MQELAKAYVNLFAAMGTLEQFVELVPSAKKLISGVNLKIRFRVIGGPDGVVDIGDEHIKVYPYNGNPTNIVLICKNPAHFNKVVDGKAMPIPVKGIVKTLKFLGKPESPFNVLTKNMAELMRKKEFDSEEERRISTLLAFNAMVAALAEVGNHDPIARLSKDRIEDGEIAVEITSEKAVTLIKKDNQLYYSNLPSKNPRAYMTFDSIDTAKGLIDGTIDALSSVAQGKLSTRGMVPMLENLNKILNLVPKYLA